MLLLTDDKTIETVKKGGCTRRSGESQSIQAMFDLDADRAHERRRQLNLVMEEEDDHWIHLALDPKRKESIE